MSFKAVVFDIGGVVVGSPLEGIREYEQEHGIPEDYINIIIVRNGEQGAFQRLERGELELQEFYRLFENELTDPTNYPKYEEYLRFRQRPVPTRPSQIKIDGFKLFHQMMSKATTPHPHMLEAIQRLKANGYVVAALTNNIQVNDGSLPTTSSLASHFHFYIESSVEGLRKPDPRFFQLALDRLKLKATECIFLDDLGINLKAAQKIGFTTIRVELYKSREALMQLEKLVNIKLLDAPSKL